MKKTYYSFFCLMLLSLFAKASHISGGDITYQCLGNNQYVVVLNLFQDCTGFDPGASQTINVASSCGNLTLTVDKLPDYPIEVSQLCAAQAPNSTCQGGSLTGMLQHTYVDTITLQPNCLYSFSWEVCCRNTTTNVPTSSGDNSYIEASVNTAECNTSPQFTAQPIPYVCANQTVNYSFGIVETDGDSLVYVLVPGMTSATGNLTYGGTYSGTNPINGITIDPNTGTLTFNSPNLGNFIVVIEVQEWRDGVLIGTVMRDIQIVIQPCSNNIPEDTAGAVTNLFVNGLPVTPTGPYQIQICEGSTIEFDAIYNDVDTIDSLMVLTNIFAVLPGATYTVTGTNPITVHYSWTAPGGTAGTNTAFSVTIDDGACPVPGQQTFVYDINILPGTVASPDVTICGTQSAVVSVLGGTSFTWTVVSGDPITPVNFSCDTCSVAVATPAVTTTYEVVSNFVGACQNRDTVTVFVAPDFSYIINQTATGICMGESVTYGVIPNPAGNYTYSWTPSATLSNNNTSTTTGTYNTPGPKTHYVTIASDLGCVKFDSVNVNVSTGYKPEATIIADSLLCSQGDTATLFAQIGNGIPPVCGVSATGCSSIDTIQLGNNNAGFGPTPYQGFYEDGRIQMLFTQAELSAMGFPGGKISQVAFNVTGLGSTIPYNGFTIKMGCTTISNFNGFSQFVPGMTTVYSNASVTPTAGWNNYTLTTGYEYDGVSNLIVEVCFDNADWTGDDDVAVSNTPFVSTISQRQDGAVGCSLNSPFDLASVRPDIRFGTCGAAPDPANYSFHWIGDTTFINPADTVLQNPQIHFTSPTTTPHTYTVIVTDIVGGCSDTASFTVNFINQFDATIDSVGAFCEIDPSITLTAAWPNGVWSGPGITDSLAGTFSPSDANFGNNTIIYTIPGACGNADTINIEVFQMPDTTYSTPSDMCVSSMPVALSGYLTSQAPVQVWSGNGITNPSDGTFDPSVSGPGIHTITFSLSNGGCFSDSSMKITVLTSPEIQITGDTILCSAGDTAVLTADIINAIPAVCGANPSPCTSLDTLFIGTGTTSLATLPTPYQGFYEDGRIQMLYTQAELNALGFMGGRISELAFNILTKQSTIPYNSFSIKMGCTNQADFNGSTTFIPGLTTVYSNPSVVPATGWNTYPFSTNYDWDGTSNLVVEVCFDNAGWTSDDVVAQSTTTHVSTISQRQDGSVGCNLNSPFNTYSVRPNIRLGMCGSQADPNLYTFHWLPDSTFINLADTAEQTITTHFTSPTTTPHTYTVVVTNSGGCTDTASVTVNFVNQFNVAIDSVGTMCANSPAITLTSAYAGGVWQGPGITDSLAGTFNPAMANSGNNQIIYTVAGACGNADTVTLVISPTPDSTFTPPPAICSGGGAVVLSSYLTSQATTQTWSGTGITNPNTGTFDPSFSGVGTFNISFTLSNGVCSSSGVMSISVIQSPNITNPATPITLCANAPNQSLLATPAGGTWTGPGVSGSIFTPSVAGPGVHTVYYTLTGNPGGCNSDSVVITVTALPTPVIINPGDQCSTGPVITIPSNNPAGTLIWSGTGIVSSSLGTFNPASAVIGANIIQLSVNDGGCIGVVTDTIYVLQTPVAPVFTAIPSVCFGDEIENPSVAYGGTTTGTINWYADAALTTFLGSGNPLDTAFTSSVTIYATEQNGTCEGPATPVEIVIDNNPVAEITADPVGGQAPLSVNFSGSSSYSNVTDPTLTYSWNFADSSNVDVVVAPGHIFANPGTYNVQLTVTNIHGCIDTASITVVAEDFSALIIPNIFTPNNDGDNDVFKASVSSGLASFKATIYNRWGKKMAESTDPQMIWDGTNAEDGVYFFIIEGVVGVDRKEYPVIKGHVTLRR